MLLVPHLSTCIFLKELFHFCFREDPFNVFQVFPKKSNKLWTLQCTRALYLASQYYFLNSRELLISMACIFCWIISPVCDKQAQAVHSFSFCKSHMKGELLLLCLLLQHLEIPEIKIILLYYQNSDLLSIQYPLPLHKCYTSINYLKINFQGQ